MIETMVLSIEQHHRMTVDEFERYCEEHPDDRLELIDGEIHTVSPQTVLHVDTVERVHSALRDRYPEMRVRQAGSILLDDHALWEPDVYVARPRPGIKYPHASDVVLVVEVALNTEHRDLGSKLAGYARNAIPEYWVIDPKPGGLFFQLTNPHVGGYRDVKTTSLPSGIDSLPF